MSAASALTGGARAGRRRIIFQGRETEPPLSPDGVTLAWPTPPAHVRLVTEVDVLIDRYRDVASHAVDTLELAAHLETSGITDDRAREIGRTDVFTLADEMWRFTDRAAPSPLRGEHVPTPFVRQVVRGTLYLLPALLAAALFSRDGAVEGTALLLVALIGGWSLSQALAYWTHVWLGRGRRPAAGRLLFIAVATTAGSVTAIAATWTAVGGRLSTTSWIAMAEVVYFVASTALLLLARERWLLAAMAPVGLLCLISVVFDDVPFGVLATAAGLTIVGVAMLGGAVAWVEWRNGEAGGALSAHDRAGAVPHAILGALLAVLLVWSSVDRVIGGGRGSAFLAPATVPVVIGSALAEWRIYRYRTVMTRLLRGIHAVSDFRGLAGNVLLHMLLRYAGWLSVITLAIVGVRMMTTGVTGSDLVEHAALLLLGCVYLLASLLAAFGFVAIVAAIVGTTTGTCILAQLLVRPQDALQIWSIYLVSTALIVAGLAMVAWDRLTETRAHR